LFHIAYDMSLPEVADEGLRRFMFYPD